MVGSRATPGRQALKDSPGGEHYEAANATRNRWLEVCNLKPITISDELRTRQI